MSDTITITPEERAEWRNRLTLLKREVENKGFRHGCAEMALRLLNVLEQAEARAEKAEAMVDWLAVRCAIHCRDKWPGSVECNVEDCTIGPCIRASSDKWAEAASRAVATGEG